MKFSYKLVLSFLVVASLTSLTTFFTLQSYQAIDESFHRLIEDPTKKLEALNDLRIAGVRIVATTSEFAFIEAESRSIDETDNDSLLSKTSQSEEEVELAEGGYFDFEVAFQRYQNLAHSDDISDSQRLEAIRSTGYPLIEISKQLIDLKKDGKKGDVVLDKKEEFEIAERAFLDAINVALKSESAQQLHEQSIVNSTISVATNETIAVSAIAFLIAIALGLFIALSISRRLEKLRVASMKLGEGLLETKVPVEGKDEIAKLGESFNKMATTLLESRDGLVSSKAFTENVIASIADALFVTDADLKVVEVNDAACELTGFSQAELLGKSIRYLRPEGGFFDDKDMSELMAKSRVTSVATHLTTKNNRSIAVLLSASLLPGPAGGHSGVVCVARDITDIKDLEVQLTHQALHDPLTKLANRVLFRDRVEHAFGRSNRSREPFGVLFLDLDNFKMINDTLGHAVGDGLLVSVAERLQACLRVSDTAARMGGDEFAILVEDTLNTNGALSVAERIMDILKPPFTIDGKEISVGASIGIATTDKGSADPDALLRNADVAMYIAKSRGKGGYAVFETEMHEVLLKRVELEADMQRGVDMKEFELHYQPIIDLESKEMIGMEALVRWNHPELGMIPPADFISVAEETGLIVPLGEWILMEACGRAREWQIKLGREFSITVNISSRQFRGDSLIDLVDNAITRAGLNPSNLILEITESTMLQNTDDTQSKLERLKKIGVRLAIDDFGTGYSSLSYLQRFPLDILKIDKSFIDRVCQGKEGAAVARAIITMGDTLHLKTIAEGIESPEQSVELKKLGCEMGQGFHFARPLNCDQMELFLAGADMSALTTEALAPVVHPVVENPALHLSFT